MRAGPGAEYPDSWERCPPAVRRSRARHAIIPGVADDISQTTARLVEVLHQLDDMAAANIARSKRIRARIRHLITRLEAGEPLPDILERAEEPLIPSLITENIEALHEVGSRLRKAEAAALRAHGYTMQRIANLFGVTRQRISALLQGDDGTS